MANILAAATGNWFTAGTWTGGVVPKAGDNAYTNGYNVTVNSVTVSAGSFEVGYKYKIKTPGDTDFTLIGAADNNVGTVFTATAVGSGTGDAYRVASATQVSNLAEAGATGSGTVVLSADQMELHANVVGGPMSLVVASVASPNTVRIVGNVTGGTYGASSAYAVGGFSTGTCEIVGNVTGGSGTSSTGAAVYFNSAGVLRITGNVTGSSAAASTQPALRSGTSADNGTIEITGNVAGGSVYDAVVLAAAPVTVTVTGDVSAGSAAGSDGIVCSVEAPASLTVTGNVYGSDASTGAGINAAAATVITVNGNVYAGKTGNGIAGSTLVNTITINGAVVGNDYGNGSSGTTAAIYGINHSGQNAVVIVRSIELGSRGNAACNGPVYVSGSANTFKARLSTPGGGSYDQLVLTNPNEDQDFPVRADVRDGVAYDYGDLVGTLKVPAAGSVALGVEVDDTVGTALLTPAATAAAVWDALLADLDTPNSIGNRLKNAATVGSTGDQLAALGG